MRPHRRKCDDRRDIREGILRALRGMALPMCIRHPEARGCSGFVRLAYIPVRSMSGPQVGLGFVLRPMKMVQGFWRLLHRPERPFHLAPRPALTTPPLLPNPP